MCFASSTDRATGRRCSTDDKKKGGDPKKEVFYELARDKSGHWVVDDIYLKQKRKGIEAYKSVTEQMDLLRADGRLAERSHSRQRRPHPAKASQASIPGDPDPDIDVAIKQNI